MERVAEQDREAVVQAALEAADAWLQAHAAAASALPGV